MSLPRLYTPEQAATDLGVPAAALVAAIGAGELGHVALGARTYLTEPLITDWLSRITRTASAPCPAALPLPAPAPDAAGPVAAPGSSGKSRAAAGTSASPSAERQRSVRQATEMLRDLLPSSASTRRRGGSKRPAPDPRQLDMFPGAQRS